MFLPFSLLALLLVACERQSVAQNAEHEFYTNAAGARLVLLVNYHVTVNANGNVKVSRDPAYDCIGG